MKRVLGGLTVLFLAAAAPALADHHEAHGKGGKPEKAEKSEMGAKGPSPETRAKMADAHEKLAACLRSTRPIGECHAEMKQAHQGMGHGCDCADGHHGNGECSEHGSGDGHGKGHGAQGKSTGKGGKAPGAAPSSSPTTSGAIQ